MSEGRFSYSKKVRNRAKKLRFEGWTYKAISEEVGASATTVAKWCDPERRDAAIVASYQWNRKNRPNWCKRHRRRHLGKECGRCRGERREVRLSLAARWWAEGLPAAEIAERLGMTVWSFYNTVHEVRGKGNLFLFPYRKELADPKYKGE